MIRLAFDFIFNSRLFLPTYRVSEFSEIVEIARKSCTKFIIFDKDDTLTQLKQFTIQDETIKKTLEQLQSMNITLKILSNSIKASDPQQMEGMQILRMKQKKPYNEEEVKRLTQHFKSNQVIIVGDRLMTDIYLANKLGVNSILVPPVENSIISKHGFGVAVLRRVQNLFLKIKEKA